MTSAFAKFRSRPHSDQRLLVTALLVLPLFQLGLRLFDFGRVQRWLIRTPAKQRPPLPFEEFRAIGALVNSAAYYALGPGTCLIRSLCLQWLLRRRGVQSELRIGVRLVQGTLEAHAWVEVDGRAVNDAPEVTEGFAPFDGSLSDRLVASVCAASRG